MVGDGRPVDWRPEHGWLAVALPSEARTFRTPVPEIAAVLEASGATPADDRPDVEIADRAGDVRGDADAAIVVVSRPVREGASAARRIPGRLAGAAAVGAAAVRAVRRLRAAGHRDVAVAGWDQLRLPVLDLRGPAARRARALARGPLTAILTGRRATRVPSVLDAAAAAARAAAPDVRVPDPARTAPRVGLSGVVLVLDDEAVLRVVLRAGGEQISDGLAVLEALRAAGPEPVLGDRIAWPLASGELPLARWVVEPRLPGATAPAVLDDTLLGDCVAFLGALFSTRVDAGAPARSLQDAARVVAAVCPPDEARAVLALGERLERELADVPRGTGHGDFWAENLLVSDGRLTGVVDWSGAGPGRLALTDLLHLLVTSETGRTDRSLGDAVVSWLVPEARAGRLPGVGDYAEALGLDAPPALVERLCAAYWLEHVAAHLASYADRAARPAWLQANVVIPAHRLTAA